LTSRKLIVVIVGLGIGLVLLATWRTRRWITASPEPVNPLEQRTEAPKAPAPDERFRRMVIATWTDDYQGKRTMTLHEDGTGTMIVELTGWRAALSAPKLRFNMKWSVENGHLKKQTISGEPEAQVKMILRTMGDHVDEPILELTEDRLLLLDGDGKTRYEWRRVREAK
jgi:hypothetical protein